MSKSSPGHQFRVAILERYEPASIGGLLILDMAAETLNECHEIKAAIERTGYEVKGTRGQLQSNPLLRDLRAHREAFIKLAEKVEPGNGKPVTRQAAAALASKRWGK